MAIKAKNQMTVIDLTDGYSVNLSCDSYTFMGDTDSVSGTQTVTSVIQALCGDEIVACSVGEISAPEGLSIVSDGKTPSPTLTITATSALTRNGSVIIPINIGEITISKVFSYSIAFKGATGAKGDRGLQGLQGPEGKQGIQGPAGTNGKTTYFHIKYSTVPNPTSTSQMTETPSTYIGTYVDFTQEDSTDPSKYTWSRFVGAQGAKGDQGIQGINGENGKTSYLHIAYANSADGSSGFSTTDSTGKLYIGQYTDFASGDSTDYKKYSWTKIKGETGAQGPQGQTGAQGKPGADALTLVISSSKGNIFKNTAIATTLTAHVYKAGTEITGSALAALGTIKWYKDGSQTAVATGSALTINPGDVTNNATYTEQLEG